MLCLVEAVAQEATANGGLFPSPLMHPETLSKYSLTVKDCYVTLTCACGAVLTLQFNSAATGARWALRCFMDQDGLEPGCIAASTVARLSVPHMSTWQVVAMRQRGGPVSQNRDDGAGDYLVHLPKPPSS